MLSSFVFERKAGLIQTVGENKSHLVKASSVIPRELQPCCLLAVGCEGHRSLPCPSVSRSRGVLGARLEGLH